MKKILTLALAFWFVAAPAHPALAHGGEDHKKKNEDNTEVQDSAYAPQESSSPASLTGNPPETTEHRHATSQVEGVAAFSDFYTLHPLVVHFPIVLLIAAAVFQLLSFFFYQEAFGWTTFLLLFFGVITAYAASAFVHPHTQGLSTQASFLLEEHERYADWTLWLGLAAFLLKTANQLFFGRKRILEIVVALLLLGSAVAVSLAGHHGAQLVHLEGVGPKGEFLELHEH